jgi:NTE family protein
MAVMTLVFKAGHRRPETASKTAFVLSGGGNHGSAQVGMLRALLERGIAPDVVIGTSAGALNGSAIAADPSLAGVDHLANVWSALRTEHIFPGGRFGRAWSLLSGGDHLYSNAGLATLIDQMAPAAKFSELVIPLRVVACDLATGEEVVLASGPLKPALLASAALPGSFPPVLHDHRTLVDGGVVDNVPLSHALAGPVDRIYVLNVSGGVADAPVRNPLDVVLRAFAIARNQRFERELALAPASVEIIVLPRPADGRSPFDFSGAETIIDEAHILAGRFLDSRRPDHHRPRRRFRRAHAA